jgi:spore maturation protein CgeB
MSLSILYVGPPGGTSRHRAEALGELGHDVVHVASGVPQGRLALLVYRLGHRLDRHPDLLGANRAILAHLAGRAFDVLWIDKGREIKSATLARARRQSPRTRLVAYSPDDMNNPDNQSVHWRRGVPLYDLHVTTKSYNVAELRAMGAQDVMFVDNAYDPREHRPWELTPAERDRFGVDVGFIGTLERDRAQQMLALARRGITVDIWGDRWERFRERDPRLRIHRRSLWGAEYGKALGAIRINLAFLRKAARDLQTTRSIEIPACGGFMLAERTDEHRRLFDEGREAEFFGSTEELETKIRYYSEHEDERARIAAAGRARCLRDRYDNAGRLAAVIEHLRERLPAH